MSPPGFTPPLNQIAFSMMNTDSPNGGFREGFGLLPTAGSIALMRGPLAANVRAYPTRPRPVGRS